MSELLEEFAEPLLRTADSADGTKRALLVAIAAWNYSLLPETTMENRDAPYAGLLADPNFREIFEFMVARKREHYPDNRRVILDYQLIPQGGEFRFNVISTVAPLPAAMG